jgi:hypothetical protein
MQSVAKVPAVPAVKVRNPGGRKGLYTPARGEKIARLVAAGSTLKAAAVAAGLDLRTVHSWRKHEKFQDQLLEARREGAEVLMDKGLEHMLGLLAGDIEAGRVRASGEGLKHLRWLLGKVSAGRYGVRSLWRRMASEPIASAMRRR